MHLQLQNMSQIKHTNQPLNLNHKPQTPKPKTQTSNLKPQTPNPKPAEYAEHARGMGEGGQGEGVTRHTCV